MHKSNGVFTIYLVKEIRPDGTEIVIKHYTKAGTAKGYATRRNNQYDVDYQRDMHNYQWRVTSSYGMVAAGHTQPQPTPMNQRSKFIAYSMTGPLVQL